MKYPFIGSIVASLMATTAFAGNVDGYLYTTLNGETTNQVISFERNDDGTIGAQRAYSTGSLGGANRAAGGDAAEIEHDGEAGMFRCTAGERRGTGKRRDVIERDRQEGRELCAPIRADREGAARLCEAW